MYVLYRKCEGTGRWVGVRGCGRYIQDICISLDFNHFLSFLSRFSFLFCYFLTNMLLQSHSGYFARAPPFPVNEGGMLEDGNVKLACSLLKMSKFESFYT